MKTFKQFIDERETMIYAKLKAEVTKEPFNFTWVNDSPLSDIIGQEKILAQRDIPSGMAHKDIIVDHTDAKFLLKYDNSRYTIEYPYLRDINQIFKDHEMPVFVKRSDLLTSLNAESENNLGRYIPHYESFNEYCLLDGDNREKHYKVYQMWIPFWRRNGMWYDTDDMLMLRAKRLIYGDESLSTDNWIDIGMSNI